MIEHYYSDRYRNGTSNSTSLQDVAGRRNTRTLMNRHAKFDAASFILSGETRNRTHTHTDTNKQNPIYPHFACRHVWIQSIVSIDDGSAAFFFWQRLLSFVALLARCRKKLGTGYAADSYVFILTEMLCLSFKHKSKYSQKFLDVFPKFSLHVWNRYGFKNSSGDEIANVNFFYDDIAHQKRELCSFNKLDDS